MNIHRQNLYVCGKRPFLLFGSGTNDITSALKKREKREMTQELAFRLLLSIILIVWLGYYILLAWISPSKFRKMAEKSLFLYGNASFMKTWIHSTLFILLTRVVGTIFISAWFFVFVMAVKDLISLLK